MRKILHDNFMRIVSLLVFVVLCVAMVLGGHSTAPIAYADTLIGDVQMDSSNVMDDLQSSTVDGEAFDFRDYAFDEQGETNVFALAEYCYSFYGNMQGNYGLYVYVHNPRGLTFNLNSLRNTIQLRAGEQEHFTKYTLLYLNQCEIPNYEGLFLKFKVYMTGGQKAAVLESLNSAERTYEVAEIELVMANTGEVENYTVSTTYFYTGYAAGYGSNPNADTTLDIKSEQAKTLSLKPYSTAYRPAGTNGKNDYTQDSLHSVYFAVPNEFIELFGEMSAVHARWLDAVLKPILVTGNQAAYNAIRNYLGVDLYTVDGNQRGGQIEDIGYLYLGDLTQKPFEDGGYDQYWYGYSYNFPDVPPSSLFAHEYFGDVVNPLYYIFNSGDSIDSADNYTVSSEDLIAALKRSKGDYGGELVNDKYSRAIFESVANEFTEVNIERETEYALTSEVISQTWWEKIWGNSHVESSQIFNGIQAIYAISPETDLQGTDVEIAERLYVSAGDVQDLKDYCNAPENADSTVYLFRYQTSDYISQEATCLEWNGRSWVNQDTNAYFFQETVNLDFDIIDVTFSNGEKDTVIPVAMKPIDIVSAATPPVDTNSDNTIDWWKLVLMVLALIVLLVIFMPILPYIAKAIVWIISLPFKAISALVNAIKKAATKKPKTTANSPTKTAKAPQPKTVYVKSDKPKQSKEKQNK